MKDTIVYRAFTDPSGGWGSVINGLLVVLLIAFLFGIANWRNGARKS